jgi:site-specific DNA recombinase
VSPETAPLKLCAIYTRKSSEEGLEQEFNSLDAQREACEAYILSQRHEGWRTSRNLYDDGGFSGGSMERPALKQLLTDIEDGKVNTVVVYKVDRLTRSLADFAKIIEIFDRHKVSFVSITQQFNTTTSMGRLTLNVLLSFAQFEREVTGERIRDKIAASKRKGMWMGGMVPLGYQAKHRKLVLVPDEARRVRWLFRRYLELGCVRKLKADLDTRGFRSKVRVNATGRKTGGASYSRGALYKILQNPIYLGEIHHKANVYRGEHPDIVPRDLWQEVQQRLRANNNARRTGLSANTASLLAGLLFDEKGRRYTPSHTLKAHKRYRYYISQSVIQGLRSSGPTRVPAHEIEALVCSRLVRFLGSPKDLIKAFRGVQACQLKHLIAAAKAKATGWPEELAPERRAALLSIIHRIVISESKVLILVSRSGLFNGLLDDSTTANGVARGLIKLAASLRLSRTGAEIKLVLPSGEPTTARPSPALLKAVVRAREWYEKLVRGEFTGREAIAAAERVTSRYVGRILESAFLAPDLVEMILEGKQPPGLSIETFRRRLPVAWDEQRKLLHVRR